MRNSIISNLGIYQRIGEGEGGYKFNSDSDIP